MGTRKNGRDLERLVEVLEGTLVKKDNVKIEARKRLRDKRTGKLREFDVVMTTTMEHHVFITAFECRERSNKVTVGEVEGYHQKCLDCGVNQGGIVSSKGFWKSARTKARSHGIRCLEVLEAKSFDWLAMTGGMSSLQIKVVHVNLIFMPKIQPEKKPTRFKVFGPNREEANVSGIIEQLRQGVDKAIPGDAKSGTHTVVVKAPAPGFFIKDEDTGEEREISEVIAEFTVELEVTVNPFQLYTYSEEDGKGLITQVAKTPVMMGTIEADLLYIKLPDGQTQISLAKKPPAKPPK